MGSITTTSARTLLCVAVGASALSVAYSRPARATESLESFNVARGDLASVLNEIASVGGKPVAFPAEIAAGKQAGPITGRKSMAAALGQALSGTGLVVATSAGGAFIVRADKARVAGGGDLDIPDIDVTANASSHGDNGFSAGDAGPSTRIDAPLKEIPLSISVVTNDVLKSQNITSVADATQNVAGVTYTPGAAGPPTFNIRGFQSTSASVNGFQGGALATVPIDDIDRIEVLKGPTSILTGSSAQGGIVNITTKAPTEAVIRDATIRLGSFGYRTLAFDLGGPVPEFDGLTYRLNISGNAASQTYGGYEDPHEYLISPSVRWRDEATSVTFGLRYYDIQTGQQPQTTFDPTTGRLVKINRGVPFGGPYFNTQAKNIDLYSQISHDFGTFFGFDVTANNKIQYTDQGGTANLAILDRFVSPGRLAFNSYNFRYHYPILTEQADVTVKQDLGFMKQTMRFGFDYNDLTTTSDYRYGDSATIDVATGLPYINRAPRAPTDKAMSTSRARTTGFSFADKIDTFDDRLHIFGLVRQDYFATYSRDRFGDITDGGQWGLSWAAGGAFDLTPWLTLFGNLNAGFYPQVGINGATGAALPPSGQEQKEGGVRLFLFDKRLTLSGTVYEQAQTNFALPSATDPSVTVLVPAQTTKGVEFEASGEVLPGWNVIASFSTRKTTYPDPLVSTLSIPGVPKLVANIWSTYAIQTGPFAGLWFGGGAQAQSESVFQTYASTGELVVPGYTILNAAIGYKKDDYDVNLKINNLLNKTYYFPQATLGTPVIYVAQGLNVLLTARYSF